MTLQTDLQGAVARVQTNSQLLHNIVHGDDQTIVPTDGGNVKSAAKAIKDIEDSIQAGLTDLGAFADQLNNAVSQTETYHDEAQSSAQSALQTANALNLPTNIHLYPLRGIGKHCRDRRFRSAIYHLCRGK